MRIVTCFVFMLMLNPTSFANNRDLYQDQESNLIEMNDVSAVVIDGVILLTTPKLKAELEKRILSKFLAEQNGKIQSLKETHSSLKIELRHVIAEVSEQSNIRSLQDELKVIEREVLAVQEKYNLLAQNHYATEADLKNSRVGFVTDTKATLDLEKQLLSLEKTMISMQPEITALMEAKEAAENVLKEAKSKITPNTETVTSLRAEINKVEKEIIKAQKELNSFKILAEEGKASKALEIASKKSPQTVKSIKILGRIANSLSVLAAADIAFRAGMIIFDYDTDPSEIPGAAIYKTIEYVVE